MGRPGLSQANKCGQWENTLIPFTDYTDALVFSKEASISTPSFMFAMPKRVKPLISPCHQRLGKLEGLNARVGLEACMHVTHLCRHQICKHGHMSPVNRHTVRRNCLADLRDDGCPASWQPDTPDAHRAASMPRVCSTSSTWLDITRVPATPTVSDNPPLRGDLGYPWPAALWY